MNDEGLAKLREPFPEGTVGVLPKPYKKDSPRGNCGTCGGYHGLPAAHLDFVGHAAVTDRLLTVDPGWSWEPLAFDERGLPALDRDGNLWIRLTVCDVSRIGVGDGPSMKERIGDALRNAAMRFGVALSLWTKDELESGHAEAKAVEGSPDAQSEQKPPRTTTRRPPPRLQADPETGEIEPDEFAQNAPHARTEASNGNPVSAPQLGYLTKLQKRNDLSTSDLLVLAGTVTKRTVAALGELTVAEATALIDHLKDPTQKGTT